MRVLKKLTLLGVMILGAVAALATTAGASTGLAIRPGGATTSSGRVTFTGGGLTVTCNLTLNESLPTSIRKVVGATLSSVTSASVSACNLGVTATFLFPGPWTGGYTSFVGTLPNITELNGEVANGGMLVNIPGIGACLFARGFRWRWLVIGGFIAIRRLTWLWVLSRTLSGICPASLSGGGDLTVSPRQALTLV